MKNKLVDKDSILVVLVNRYVGLSYDGSYLIKEFLPRNKRYRKVIRIEGKYIDIYTGDEIMQVESENDIISSEIRVNTNYLGGIIANPELEGIRITNKDVKAAYNILKYFLIVYILKSQGKIIDFPQKRIY